MPVLTEVLFYYSDTYFIISSLKSIRETYIAYTYKKGNLKCGLQVLFEINRLNFVKTFFLPKRQSLFYFNGAGKFCLDHGLRQLTCDVNSDVRTLKSGGDVTYAQPRRTSNDIRRWPIKC